jgi:hypothetical protein
MTPEKVDEVVAVWEEMGKQMRLITHHMISSLAAQTSTERAARHSAAAVKLAACGFLVVLSIASFVIGTMVQASITVAASQRSGLIFQLEAVEHTLEKNTAALAECRKAPAPMPVLATAPPPSP